MSIRIRRLFHSRRFFVFNLVLAGAVAGLVVAFAAFSLWPRSSTGEFAQSQGVSMQNALYKSGPVDPPIGTTYVPATFRYVAAKVLPEVVEINVVDIVKQKVPVLGQGFPFNFFFQQAPGQQQAPKTREFKQQALGSGVIVRRSGNTVYVLTNNHVAGDAKEIRVTLYDKRTFKARLVGKDPRLDLALVAFTTSDRNIPVATLGNSNNMHVGDWVIAVGNPFGFMSTVTQGIVSAIGREGDGPSTSLAKFIQTDAAINKGNSGGALVNMKGHVVGINSWIASPAGGSVGLGFAIAINDAKRDINQFIEHGSVQYGWLGASVAAPYDSLAKAMDLTGKQGSMIYHVFVNSPADKGGLKPGDFVTSINGERVTDTTDLVRIVGDLPVGKDATFDIVRYGHPMTVSVPIGLRESQKQIEADHNLWPGITALPIDGKILSQLKLPEGTKGVIVAQVVPQTPAAIAGIQQGDVIQAINNKPVNNAIDFYRGIDASARDFNFQIDRQGTIVNIGIVR